MPQCSMISVWSSQPEAREARGARGEMQASDHRHLDRIALGFQASLLAASIECGDSTHRVPVDGSTARSTCSGTGTFCSGTGVDANVYWTAGSVVSADVTVTKLPLAGGSPVQLASGQRNLCGVTVDAARGYLTQRRERWSGDSGGGGPATVAVRDEIVHWTNNSGGGGVGPRRSRSTTRMPAG